MYRETEDGRAEIRVESEVDAVLKALAHPFRRAAVEMLVERDTDATELTIVAGLRFGLASSTASWHLGVLRAAGIVRSSSKAPVRVYSLASPGCRALGGWVARVASAEPGRCLPFEVEG